MRISDWSSDVCSSDLSAFFGPIKYAILPQHLREKEVLGGTGLVEAGTYAAILGGTIVGGIIPPAAAAGMVLMVAAAGWLAGRQVTPAPPVVEDHRCDWHIVRASIRLVRDAMRVRRLDLAILCISFFWAVGTILASPRSEEHTSELQSLMRNSHAVF